LGTCLLMEQDRWTSLALCLIKYWCAEALAQQQTLIIPVEETDNDDEQDEDIFLELQSLSLHEKQTNAEQSPVSRRRRRIESFLRSLPKNLHKAAAAAAKQQSQSSATDNGADNILPSSNLETLQEGENGEEDDEDDQEKDDSEAGLKIAWQYKKSVQQKRLGYRPGISSSSSSQRLMTTTDPYCHSYDLRYTDEIQVEDHDIDLMAFQCNCLLDPGNRSNHQSGGPSRRHGSPCAFALYHQLVRRVEDAVRAKPRTVIRLFLYHLDPSLLSVALPLFLTHIRTHGLAVVILVAVQSWNLIDHNGAENFNSLRLLRRECDVVLQCEGFAARSEPPPPEFGNQFQGLLSLPKMTLATAATAVGSGGHFADATVTKRPTATRFGLKRDRRKLHIQLLHIPPEDYAQGGGSVGGGGVRSGAGQRPQETTAKSKYNAVGGCASSGGSSPLDF